MPCPRCRFWKAVGLGYKGTGTNGTHLSGDAVACGAGATAVGKEVCRQQSAKQGGQIGQRQVAELLQFVDDAAGGGGLRTSLKRAREVGQKAGEKCHAA